MPNTRFPIIGISANKKEGISCIADAYYQAIIMARGAPVIIPVTTDIDALQSVVETLDGLLISGGGDINPNYFGQDPIPELDGLDDYRDEYDFKLLKLCFERQIPVFGICRGHQLINVAFGGTMYQDIHTCFSANALKHSQEEPRDATTHEVLLTDIPSKLRQALNNPDSLVIPVNSFHHQAVKDIAPGFIETAKSPDGINEATEHPEYNIFSVQWHPENLAANIPEQKQLFKYLIENAKIYKKAKDFHNKHYSIDSHCDTPMFFAYNNVDIGIDNAEFLVDPKDLDVEDESPVRYKIKVDVPTMQKGLLDATFMVAYLPQKELDEPNLKLAVEKAENTLQKIIFQTNQHSDIMGIARNFDDLKMLKNESKKAIFLGIENGYGLGNDLRNIEKFYNIGVRYITLCHNGDNQICDSAVGSGKWGGLSPFGKEVITEMNRLGVMIDVSHSADSTFYDVLKYSAKPVIASHSSCRALCNHNRNLDDEQIKALAENKGVIQICLYKNFINNNPEKASVDDAVKHICHVVDLVGVDYAGIGSDFDGGGELTGCQAANELIQITMRLIACGFDDESIAKIWGGNLLRVMSYELKTKSYE